MDCMQGLMQHRSADATSYSQQIMSLLVVILLSALSAASGTILADMRPG